MGDLHRLLTTTATRGGELGRGSAGLTIVHGGDLEGLLDPAGFSLCPGFPPRGEYGWVGGLAHELGHAFGIDSSPGVRRGPRQLRLSWP